MEVVIINPTTASSNPEEGSNYDMDREIQAFVDAKTCVKELVDSGGNKIPKFFVHPPEIRKKSSASSQNSNINNLQIPIIDFNGFEDSLRRTEVVNEICKASEEWGFFQIVNHGIPVSVMDEMLRGIRRFNEQSKEAKMELYSYDPARKVRFIGGGFIKNRSEALKWRDTIKIDSMDGELDPEIVPEIFREEVTEYMKHIRKIRKTLCELFSEALGLPTDYLSSIECAETESLLGHYYPACPEPELTIGATSHKDPSFVTVLLPESISGLQIHHQNQWVDVPLVQGALVVNVGDLMQLITNDRFQSVNHRVVVQEDESRASVACFFYPNRADDLKLYGPIKELVCGKPPLYRGIHMSEYFGTPFSHGRDGASRIYGFKLGA